MTIRVYRNAEPAFEVSRPEQLGQIIQDDISDAFTFDADDLKAWEAAERVKHVRAEAQRRMMALLGARDKAHMDVLISNNSREAIGLLRKGSDSWTAEEKARAAKLEALDEAIDGIRAASNALEAKRPVPKDFQEEKYWSMIR